MQLLVLVRVLPLLLLHRVISRDHLASQVIENSQHYGLLQSQGAQHETSQGRRSRVEWRRRRKRLYLYWHHLYRHRLRKHNKRRRLRHDHRSRNWGTHTIGDREGMERPLQGPSVKHTIDRNTCCIGTGLTHTTKLCCATEEVIYLPSRWILSIEEPKRSLVRVLDPRPRTGHGLVETPKVHPQRRCERFCGERNSSSLLRSIALKGS